MSTVLPSSWKYTITKIKPERVFFKDLAYTNLDFNEDKILEEISKLNIVSIQIEHTLDETRFELLLSILSLPSIFSSLLNLSLVLPSSLSCIKILDCLSNYLSIQNINLSYISIKSREEGIEYARTKLIRKLGIIQEISIKNISE